jgi:hypothetical protein
MRQRLRFDPQAVVQPVQVNRLPLEFYSRCVEAPGPIPTAGRRSGRSQVDLAWVGAGRSRDDLPRDVHQFCAFHGLGDLGCEAALHATVQRQVWPGGGQEGGSRMIWVVFVGKTDDVSRSGVDGRVQ